MKQPQPWAEDKNVNMKPETIEIRERAVFTSDVFSVKTLK